MLYTPTVDINTGNVLKWTKVAGSIEYVLFESEWKQVSDWSDYEIKELFDDNIATI